MLLLKVGIRNQFAQDVVVGKEAAVLLCVCGRSGLGDQDVHACCGFSLGSSHWHEAAAGPPATPPSSEAPAAALTPGAGVRLAP